MSWTSGFLLRCMGISVALQGARMSRGVPGWVSTHLGKAGGSAHGKGSVWTVTLCNVFILITTGQKISVCWRHFLLLEAERAWHYLPGRAGCSGRQEIQKRWNSTGQSANICSCRLIKTFANKLGICCFCRFIYQSWDAHVLLIC